MTAPLLVLVPMRVEQAALRAQPGMRVLRTGMGEARARVAAARAQAIDAHAVAVAGVCAGVATDLHAGDVVCATELRRTGAEAIALLQADLVAAALRRHGLDVHEGPLLSSRTLVGPDERRALASSGAIAVDMESAWLAEAASGRPFAVVRVVADAAGRRLVDPRMLVEGTRSLRTLKTVAAALADWSREAAEPDAGEPAPPRELVAQ